MMRTGRSAPSSIRARATTSRSSRAPTIVPSGDVVEARSLARVERPHPLAVTQSSRFVCRQGEGRDVVQRRLDRQQMLGSGQTMPKGHRRIQRNRLAFGKAADGEPAQLGDMAERSERRRQIAGEGADIGAGADHRLEIGVVGVGHRDEAQLGDLDRAGGQIGRLAGAGQRIGAAAAKLDRRVGRRPLQDRAAERRERRRDRGRDPAAPRSRR